MKQLTILMLFFSLLLTGCGGSNEASSNSGEDPASPTAQPSTEPVDQPASEPAGSEVREIIITASNFEFDPKEIRVKKGEKIKLTFENKEGAHGLSIPDLNIDLKQPGSVEFMAEQTGEFAMKCSVMCGAGHAKMTGTFIVE